MRATALLCDWAEVINGKLYIQGGGWSQLTLVRPHTVAVAVKLYVPWDRTNRKLNFTAGFFNEDGEPVYGRDAAGAQSGEVKVEGQFEIGRPPGLRPGSDLDTPMVLRYENVLFETGRYNWVMVVEGNEVGRLAFDVTRKEGP